MAITRAQQYRQMLKEGSVAMQGGVKNYLGKQKTVSDVPLKWQSGKDKPSTELAYITKAEKDLLLKKDIHGSLRNGPNKGPKGIMSLDSQGDMGGSEDKGTNADGSNNPGYDAQADMTDYATNVGKGAKSKGGFKGGFGDAVSKVVDTYKQYSPLGIVTRGFKNVFGKLGPKSFTDKYGYATDYQGTRGRSSVDDDDDDIGGGDGMPLYAQLGYPSQEAYMLAMQRATQAPAGLPAAVQPMQTMDLNRIAYRFMADGGFLGEEDEPRQAYGLGSLVKKVVKKATTLPRKLIKTVKKVAKSPTGRLLLAVAAPYALGPAMASSQFLAGLSAAQKAAVISGATTGITQLASGEDLNLKDIAVSAAIGGTSAKMFPGNIPGKAPPPGVDRQAFNASRVSQGFKPSDLVGTPDYQGAIKNITPKDTGILQSLKNFGTKIKDSKLTNIIKTDGKISPTKSILLASTLSGLAAKKDQEEDEFSEVDRGPGIDIAAIRRRPFDFMAPRFAGSQFDFYDTAAAEGGRIGYEEAGAVLNEKEMKKLAKSPLFKGFKKMYSVDPQMAKDNPAYKGKFEMFKKIYDQKFQKGGKAEPVAKKVMPLLDMGGQEMDLRAEGGFVPIGRMEKADDVPARLSKNEFVFTADAVRNAGDGDVDKGAEVMYNMMKNLESGGDVSEESQGLKGARQMFQTSQRLEEVL